MLESLFLKFLNISITASWLVLAVVLFRFIFKKVPKAIHVLLWALVGIRLLCPVSFESVWSLVPSAETVPKDIMYAQTPAINSGVGILNSTVNPILESSFSPKPWESANPLQIHFFIASHVWLMGIGIMLLYMLISYLKVRRSVSAAILTEKNLWICDQIESPFILGLVCPKIYLPSNLSEEEIKYVMAHEQAHLKRLDHFWKPLGFAILTIYWFNPILWIAYVLLCRDIELACDEKVIAMMGTDNKKAYSMALLNCSVSRKSIAACPLAFGEVGVKGRIKSVLNYKKPAFWLILLAVLVFGVIAVGFLTDPVTTDIRRIVEMDGYNILDQNEYNFEIRIPKDVLSEDAFTPEGQTFKKDEVVVYSTETTNIYLEQVWQSSDHGMAQYYTFNCSYHDLDKNDSIILPYKISPLWEYSSNLNVKKHILTDGDVSVRGYGPDEKFTLLLELDTVHQTQGEIMIQLEANELFYERVPRITLKKEVKVDERLEAFLNVEVAKHFESEHSVDKFRCLDVEVLSAEARGNETVVYAWVLYQEYTYRNMPISETSAHIPTVICAEKVNDYYELVEYWEPEDGNRYEESIKEKFPERLHKDALNSLKYLDKQLMKCEEQVNAFYATSFAGKVFRGEEVVYGHRIVDSFYYSPDTIPVFVLDKANLHLLTNDFPEPSFLSSYYDIGQIQSFDLTVDTFDSLLEDEFDSLPDKFDSWTDNYSAKKIREENKNAYFVNEEGQEYNRFYYLLEQENGDIYIAYGAEGQNIRYIFKMYESVEGLNVVYQSYVGHSPVKWETPSLTLYYQNQTFTFSMSMLSSYLAHGNYTIEDEQLILKTEDGLYTYVFDISGEKLYFNQRKSSPIAGYRYSPDSDKIEYPIIDGSVFTKVE